MVFDLSGIDEIEHDATVFLVRRYFKVRSAGGQLRFAGASELVIRPFHTARVAGDTYRTFLGLFSQDSAGTWGYMLRFGGIFGSVPLREGPTRAWRYSSTARFTIISTVFVLVAMASRRR